MECLRFRSVVWCCSGWLTVGIILERMENKMDTSILYRVIKG